MTAIATVSAFVALVCGAVMWRARAVSAGIARARVTFAALFFVACGLGLFGLLAAAR